MLIRFVICGNLVFNFLQSKKTFDHRKVVQKAKVVAGQRDVTIFGSASTTKQCLNAGLADELRIEIIPVFLNTGFRPFEDIDTMIKLERIKTEELPAGRTHLRFRFMK